MWFKRENKNRNRRVGRQHVLDVKLRSEQVRATRIRLVAIACAVVFGTVFGLCLIWRTGEFALNKFVYENQDFAIQTVQVQTDGVITPEQLRHWSGVKIGANLIGLDLALVKRNLEMVYAIDSVSVERVLPQTLKIRVTERTPIAQVNVPRTDAVGNISISVFQLDASGMVMLPLDPRQCTTPAASADVPLPLITGLNLYQLQPGHRVDSPQVRAALQLLAAFGHSPMFGLVDLRHIDTSSPGVVMVTTGQGSQVTFGLENLDRQLRRWRGIYDLGARQGKIIAAVDLAVENNVPVNWVMANAAPDAPPKPVKIIKPRRKNV
ncbi:MAG TPA: FtsQ-type POTRA domain-containing protein [Verrucomicrobiae bacterium]|jgi:cell division septal protein FtsQ